MRQKMNTAEHNVKIDVIKGISMFSVICAHCNSVATDAPSIVQVQSCLIANLGTYGVITLFIVSGYLFHGKNLAYVKKKVMRILPAWIISGTVVFLYVYLRKPPVLFHEYLKYLIGQGSYLYYLPMLILFYLLFTISFFRRTAVLISLILVGLIYSCANYAKIGGAVSQYLIPLHWIQYFSLGILIQQNTIRTRIFNSDIRNTLIGPLLFISIIVILSFKQVRIGYWGHADPMIGLLGSLTALALSNIVKGGLLRTASLSGRQSLFIYLWHMPVAGVVAWGMNHGALQYFIFLRPFIVLGFMFIIQLGMQYFGKMRLQKVLSIIGFFT